MLGWTRLTGSGPTAIYTDRGYAMSIVVRNVVTAKWRESILAQRIGLHRTVWKTPPRQVQTARFSGPFFVSGKPIPNFSSLRTFGLACFVLGFVLHERRK